jgi:type IV secretory pathway VirB3-like protein
MIVITDDDPDRDSLAIPDTRPNMFLLIPYELAISFGMLFFAIDTQLHSLVKGFVVLPFWILAASLVKRDINGVRIFMIRLRLLFLYLDVARWGGFSATPWPSTERRPRRAI